MCGKESDGQAFLLPHLPCPPQPLPTPRPTEPAPPPRRQRALLRRLRRCSRWMPPRRMPTWTATRAVPAASAWSRAAQFSQPTPYPNYRTRQGARAPPPALAAWAAGGPRRSEYLAVERERVEVQDLAPGAGEGGSRNRLGEARAHDDDVELCIVEPVFHCGSTVHRSATHKRNRKHFVRKLFCRP